jgi:thioredoxin 1
MATQYFSDQDFQEKVIKNEKPVMVDFYADWCGPCKMAAPIIEELSEEYKDKAVIGKLDVDEHTQTAQQYGVMSIPTVIMFKGGEEVGRKIGFAGKAGYVDLLQEHVG